MMRYLSFELPNFKCLERPVLAYSVEKVGSNFWQMRPAVEKLKCWRS
jgi:hypothetical protein